jgi:arginyl-tRNA synthetase
MKEQIENLIKLAIKASFSDNSGDVDFIVEHPAELSHGDYSTNIALVLSKKVGANPRETAEKIVAEISKHEDIDRVEIAGPGFINFYLSESFFKRTLQQILNAELNYGRNKNLEGKIIMMEYTDPNPFKQFHIGHLMSNSIGEALSRIIEWNGADVTRICYQGDVGMHVAQTIWAMKQRSAEIPADDAPLSEKTKFVGDAYTFGATEYKKEGNEEVKAEINEINKKVYELYDRSKENDDPEIADFYEKGRAWSLQHFDEIYGQLGTNFAQLIFENQMAVDGIEIVKNNTSAVFEESDGAIVYKGEKDGLHTRVFINSLGLPTYEAKEIALAHYKENELTQKFGKFDKSVVITASEQKEYMKVVMAALSKIHPEISEKTFHITHGMMRFADGKMSSRTGNVITGESLMFDVAEMVGEKMADREISEEDKKQIKEVVSVGAIKYSILKQATGKDIIFDPEASVSFEGDSGPYLQYTYTRAKSIIDKAIEQGIFFADAEEPENWQRTDLEKHLYQFPEVIEKAYSELAPHHIVTLLTKIASEFNSFYAQGQILDGGPDEDYKLAITKSAMIVLQNGLKVLGIKVPLKM